MDPPDKQSLLADGARRIMISSMYGSINVMPVGDFLEAVYQAFDDITPITTRSAPLRSYGEAWALVEDTTVRRVQVRPNAATVWLATVGLAKLPAMIVSLPLLPQATTSTLLTVVSTRAQASPYDLRGALLVVMGVTSSNAW